MPVGKEPKLGLLLDAIRDGIPATKVKLREWYDTCRQEPILFWHTPAIRYTTYGIAGILGVLIVSSIANSLVPNVEVKAQATTTDHRVICTNSDCGKMFVIDRPFHFDDFPVTCPTCTKQTGQPAHRCNSKTCKGRWVVRRAEGERYVCPQCGADLGPVD
jgi:hypothetical protein